MKRTEPVAVGVLLERYLRDRAFGAASLEGRAVALWAEVAGEYVAGYTEDVYVRGGVIFVTFSSASVRADVFMRRGALIRELNERLRARVVKKIVVR